MCYITQIIKNRYKDRKKKIVFNLNGDWNAKHNLWGSTDTDNRGMNLLNWMTKSNLVFVNDGSYIHRHKVSGKEDAIDLSITSMDFRKNIARWKIHKDLTDSYNFSDHYIMESLVNFNPIVVVIPDRITWDFDEQLIGDFKKEMKIKMEKWKLFFNKLKNEKKNVNKLVEYFQLLFV